MSTNQQSRPEAHGSRTVVAEELGQDEAGPSHSPHHDSAPPPVGVLKLRGGPVRRQKVVWTEETIDNEGMGKKKSKICCIYHRPKAFDESSTESSSDSGDDASDDDRARRAGDKDALKKRENGSGGIEEESSDSDGGRGDGRASLRCRPSKRPSRRKHKHTHNHDCGDHDHNRVKPNKYDHREKPNCSSGGVVPK